MFVILGKAISEETPVSKHLTLIHTFIYVEQGLVSTKVFRNERVQCRTESL